MLCIVCQFSSLPFSVKAAICTTRARSSGNPAAGAHTVTGVRTAATFISASCYRRNHHAIFVQRKRASCQGYTKHHQKCKRNQLFHHKDNLLFFTVIYCLFSIAGNTDSIQKKPDRFKELRETLTTLLPIRRNGKGII